MRRNWKWKVIILHPNSMRKLAPTKLFMNKEPTLNYTTAWKDWLVEVYKKENNKLEWSEEFSIN